MPDTAPSIQVRTVLSDQGVPSVTLSISTPGNQPVHIAMLPDAAVEIGLNLISASYAARGEQAAFIYAKNHSLNTEELLRALRNGK